jgi:hypothetical protein
MNGQDPSSVSGGGTVSGAMEGLTGVGAIVRYKLQNSIRSSPTRSTEHRDLTQGTRWR